MKSSKNLATDAFTDAVETHLRTTYNANVTPRLIADWNLNRYVTPTANNVPSDDTEGFDVEAFPIESIIEPVRPTKGIIKARVNQAVVGDTYQNPHGAKFYIGDVEDTYKYWTSPYTTNSSGIFPSHTDGDTTVRPHVLYPKVMTTNKIVIKLENTWASPQAFDIRVSDTVGGTWSTISTSPPIANDGTITLYYNGTSWTSTRPEVLVTTGVAAIMIRVNSMTAGRLRDGSVMQYKTASYDLGNTQLWGALTTHSTTGANSSFNLISIEAHFEADLTERFISTSDDFEMADESQLYPIGTITSNQGNITLSNEDGIFNIENTSSPYYGIMEPNVEFNLEYIYTIDEIQHSVQGFKLLSGPWSAGDGTVDITLEDSSNWLKTVKPRSMAYEAKSATEIIWRLLDSVGFVDYEIDESDEVIEHVIPYFWTTGDETVWEILDTIAQQTQTAIYFDSNNKLQVRTRNAAFKDAKAVDWNLLGQNSGSSLADIISLEPSDDYEANKIEVKYKTTKWAVSRQGKPALEKVWEPDGEATVVRSSPLIQSIDSSSTMLHLSQSEVKIWPYKSKVNVEGEIIQYEGKRYLYYTGTNGATPNYVTVKDADELAKYNKKTPSAYRFKNGLTGGLSITERAVWNTEKFNHTVNANNWTTKLEVVNGGTGASSSGVGGFIFNRDRSTVTINTPSNMVDANDTFWAKRGDSADTGYKMYGTKMKFLDDGANTTQRGGFAFYVNGANENGYYVELSLSSTFGATERDSRSEVVIYSRNGSTYTNLAKGQAVAVGKDLFYEVDAYIKTSGAQDVISVWVNGLKVAEATTTAPTKQPEGGRVALYARGKSKIEYEYFYAVARNFQEPIDDFGFYDLKYGGVRGGMWEREVAYELKTRWKKIKKKKWTKETYRHNEYLFDEFGPYVHEVREFDVKFENGPVQYSYLFSTNDWYSTILEYTGNAFRAKFIVANTGRDHAILSGEDNLVYGGASAPVNQILTVLGRTLDIKDEESVKKENSSAIRSRGPIESELSGDWIQSKGMASSVATWMARHWSSGVDECTVEIYGNPLIEIGDVVDIDYTVKNMSPSTHKYFVVKTSNGFDGGISTTLTLRRVKTAIDIS